MKKLEFLKLAISNNKHLEKKWVITAFSVTQPTDSKRKAGDIICTATGYFFVPFSEDEKLLFIEDAVPNEPLFRFLDPITIDSAWAMNATSTIETTIGNLLFNLICMVTSFKDKVPFITGKVVVSKIEDLVAPILKDDPEDGVFQPNQIYVSEYVSFVNSLRYLVGFSQLCVVSATIKNIQIATGLTEFKKQLIEKYGDTLKDPIEFLKFQKELEAFDEDYLKDDPSMRSFMSGKVKNIARKKLFLTIGSEQTFDSDINPVAISNSLHDGWPTDPTQYTAMMNTNRSGIFSRGAETVKGGVAAKVLLRSASNFRVTDQDCGTKTGITRVYDNTSIYNLVGRYILGDKGPVLVETEEIAKTLIGKSISVRSPMYCLLKGDRLCKTCAGTRLASIPTSLTTPLTDIAAIILATSMKAMHGKVLKTADIDLAATFS